jgi:hypothetical protein
VKFKAEIFLLLTAIALFTASAFMYSYTNQPQTETLTASAALPNYPYQGYAFSFVGFGSLLMAAASLSFLKRSKPPTVHMPKRTLAKNCTD